MSLGKGAGPALVTYAQQRIVIARFSEEKRKHRPRYREREIAGFERKRRSGAIFGVLIKRDSVARACHR